MQEASANLDFEKAMECRDLINSINHVAGNQKITTHQFEDRDIIAYAEEGNDAVVQVFFVRMVSLSAVNILSYNCPGGYRQRYSYKFHKAILYWNAFYSKGAFGAGRGGRAGTFVTAP